MGCSAGVPSPFSFFIPRSFKYLYFVMRNIKIEKRPHEANIPLFDFNILKESLLDIKLHILSSSFLPVLRNLVIVCGQE